mmetsp:Transcript_13284/g.30974  ORF Transcript_13284/g.30974 Transcript_13284/m.30974 type:complete len:80 (-) Transcript_13284:100-339(-)
MPRKAKLLIHMKLWDASFRQSSSVLPSSTPKTCNPSCLPVLFRCARFVALCCRRKRGVVAESEGEDGTLPADISQAPFP